jgi:hypothetical protein
MADQLPAPANAPPQERSCFRTPPFNGEGEVEGDAEEDRDRAGADHPVDYPDHGRGGEEELPPRDAREAHVPAPGCLRTASEASSTSFLLQPLYSRSGTFSAVPAGSEGRAVLAKDAIVSSRPPPMHGVCLAPPNAEASLSVALAVLVVLVSLIGSATSRGALAGASGKIAFESNYYEIYTMNTDGSTGRSSRTTLPPTDAQPGRPAGPRSRSSRSGLPPAGVAATSAAREEG